MDEAQHLHIDVTVTPVAGKPPSIAGSIRRDGADGLAFSSLLEMLALLEDVLAAIKKKPD